MEEEIGTNHPNTPHHVMGSTPDQGHSVFDIVDYARRDFAYAYAPPPSCVNEKEPNVTGNISNYGINNVSNNAQYYYSLLEAMPLPGPTWSTTEPSLLVEPQPLAPIEAAVEVECGGENQGSSCTWWLGFLEGLDGNMNSEKLLDDPFVEGIGMVDSKVFSNESSPFVDELDLSYCPDDWLVIPTMEKDLGDTVLP